MTTPDFRPLALLALDEKIVGQQRHGHPQLDSEWLGDPWLSPGPLTNRGSVCIVSLKPKGRDDLTGVNAGMMAQQPDRVRQYLRRRGCGASIVKGGFEGLVAHWESAVQAVEEGYDLTLGDYLSDMEMRDVLAGALDVTNGDQRKMAEKRLEAADDRFRELTVDCPHLCGEQVAIENGHDPTVQWWYYRRPKRPAPDFEEELREAGLA